MEIAVAYIYDRPSGYQDAMERQLDKAGVPRIPVQIPVFTWRNRVLKTMEVAQEHPEHLLFFVDAWDTLFLGEKWELDRPLWADGITFATQKRCWPDALDMEWNVWWENKVSTRWRYLNSNPMVGKGSTIAAAIDWGWRRFPLKGGVSTTTDPSGEVCERFYTQLAFRAPKEFGIKLDTNCVLSHVTSEGTPGELAIGVGRVVNTVTDTQPVFLHLNGKMSFDLSLLDA